VQQTVLLIPIGAADITYSHLIGAADRIPHPHWLKVDGNEKLGGSKVETVIEPQSRIVAIEVYFRFERAVFV
jgi:hypothetical protein